MKEIIQKYIWLISAVISLAVLSGSVYLTHRLTDSAWQIEWDKRESEISKAENKALKDKQAQEEKWQSEIDTARKEGREKEQAARADADRANASIGELRKRINALLANAAADYPATAGGGQTAGSAINMLADVLNKSIERNRQLAEYADKARNAGQTCQRSYEVIQRKQNEIK